MAEPAAGGRPALTSSASSKSSSSSSKEGSGRSSSSEALARGWSEGGFRVSLRLTGSLRGVAAAAAAAAVAAAADGSMWVVGGVGAAMVEGSEARSMDRWISVAIGAVDWGRWCWV